MVETGGLENRLALTGYGGSNPSPSAKNSSKNIRGCLSASKGFLRQPRSGGYISGCILSCPSAWLMVVRQIPTATVSTRFSATPPLRDTTRPRGWDARRKPALYQLGKNYLCTQHHDALADPHHHRPWTERSGERDGHRKRGAFGSCGVGQQHDAS